MPSHEYFRELGALAAIGQLSADEDHELSDHLRECSSCREAHCDYERVIQHQLPQADPIRWRIKSAVPRFSPDSDLRDRFLARAHAEGIDLSAEAERPGAARSSASWRSVRWPRVLTVSAVTAVVLFGIWGERRYQTTHSSRVEQITVAESAREREGLKTQLESLRQALQQQSAELDRMKRENSVPAVSLQNLQNQLSEARERAEKLSAEWEAAKAQNARVAKTSEQKDAVLADLRAKNEKLHRDNVDNLSSRMVLEAQVRDLKASLEEQAASIERERELMVASSDVRKLMGARNLHILDVHDTDGAGKSAKAFGRVFYAEGESLIFYAFDLANGKLTPAKYTFQAWGEKESKAHSVRNLGTFSVDDHEQRRWVLKVNDPSLLRGIDSVFVTAEALGDTGDPRGKKLLYAYIVGQANHP